MGIKKREEKDYLLHSIPWKPPPFTLGGGGRLGVRGVGGLEKQGRKQGDWGVSRLRGHGVSAGFGGGVRG